MKYSLLTIIILIIIILNTSCSKAQKKVVVYTSVDRVYADIIFNDFEQATGIKVLAVYDVESSKTTGLATRLLLEKDSPKADVFWNSEIMYTIQLKNADILETFSPAKTNLPDNFIDPDNKWIAFGGRSKVWIINKDSIPKSDYPNSISDIYLLSNKYKTSIANPVFGTTATYAANIYDTLGSLKGNELFKHINEKSFIANGNSAVRDLVVSGQIDFGLTDTDDALVGLKKGANIDIRFLNQTNTNLFIIPNSVSIIKSGPNSEAANIFVNFLLKDDTINKMMNIGSIQFNITDKIEIVPSIKPFLEGNKITIQKSDYSKLEQLLNKSSHDMKNIFRK